jgi:hypothetical protein
MDQWEPVSEASGQFVDFGCLKYPPIFVAGSRAHPNAGGEEQKAAQKNRAPKAFLCIHVVVRMEKVITCTKCRKTSTVCGPYSSAKEVPQGVTCPFCGEANDVKWPMDGGFTTIPKSQST